MRRILAIYTEHRIWRVDSATHLGISSIEQPRPDAARRVIRDPDKDTRELRWNVLFRDGRVVQVKDSLVCAVEYSADEPE